MTFTMHNSIFKKVYNLTRKIPKGKVATYGDIAKKLATNPRTVGWALHGNKESSVPCHRVVDRNGKIAVNYGFGGAREQKQRLVSEGVKFKDENHVDFKSHLWRPKNS